MKYTDTISTLMIGLSLALSAASFIVCACSLFNPNNPNCADDDDDGEVTPIEDDLDDLLRDDDDYVAPCENLNWMKVLAIALTCLPIIAWLLMGPAVSTSIHLTVLIEIKTLPIFYPYWYCVHILPVLFFLCVIRLGTKAYGI